MNEYCMQLTNLPKSSGEHHWSFYQCKITGERCVAAEFENHDPGHPASYEQASYNNNRAKESCPAYDIPDSLAERLIQLRVKSKSGLEQKVAESKK